MNAPVAPPSIHALRPEAELAPESGIVEVANYGRSRPGLIPLWVGEGDLPTPAFIADAATRSLAAGETFYTWQRGIPDLEMEIKGGVHGDRATAAMVVNSIPRVISARPGVLTMDDIPISFR